MSPITRLRQPLSASRRTDLEFAINRSVFYWTMIGVTTMQIVLTTYLESMRLSGIAPPEDQKRKVIPL